MSANVYETAARAKKARSICDAVDVALLNLKIDPWSASALIIVAGFTSSQWQKAADAAGVHLPSEETRRAVVDLYRERIEHNAEVSL